MDPTQGHNEPPRTKLYKKRWLMLFIFCTLSLSNAFQWIEYAIITNIISKFYGVSELAVNWTSMVYMLTYIPLVLPATWLLDRYGLRTVALLGSFGNCVGACLKCISANPNRFYLTFTGQAISGASQIFILGIPPRLAAIWFGPKEVSTATSIGVFGNQLGIALGFLLPPVIVRNLENPFQSLNDSQILSQNLAKNVSAFKQAFNESVAYDLSTLFYCVAGVTVVVLLLTLFLFTAKPEIPPSFAQLRAIEASIEKNYLHSLKQLIGNKNFLLLVVTYGINTGAFYAVSTLLNQVLLGHYPGEEINIGRIGLVMVLSGLMGSLFCGLWLDRTKAFKMTIVVVYALSLVGMILYTFTINLKHLWLVFIISGFLGFFMTGYLPLGFEFASELTHPTSEGTSSGLLNASAQVFGICMTLAMGELVVNVSDMACNISLCLCLVVGLFITMLIKADLRRQAAERKRSSIPADIAAVIGQQIIDRSPDDQSESANGTFTTSIITVNDDNCRIKL